MAAAAAAAAASPARRGYMWTDGKRSLSIVQRRVGFCSRRSRLCAAALAENGEQMCAVCLTCTGQFDGR